ncbi:MAG: class I SAM-dependent methyltransferase [Candidatus Bathyarchaeota archaeon]|nr:class I SAM-dependent methyltransferase [Candidatus Bathyarchaeum tardum]WNZ29588.1 MAG: class I SAM-dependent methyltransferase [Candidatus Bathyarchaeota archaeon]
MNPENKQQKIMDQFKCPIGIEGQTVAKIMNRSHRALTDWGLKKVKIRSDYLILDIGCGGGKTISKLAEQAVHGKVFGIDYSGDMVDYSRQINKELIDQNRVSIVQCSVDKTGFPDSFFDLITAIETYYFWPNLAEAFEEIKRLLKPNGKLVLINEMIKDGVYEVENAEVIAKTEVKLLSLPDIQKILQSTGFKKVEVFTKADSAWNVVIAQKC